MEVSVLEVFEVELPGLVEMPLYMAQGWVLDDL